MIKTLSTSKKENNLKLLSFVHYLMVRNKRKSIAQVKKRSAINGSNAKPWKQKGTGRARHGSRQSPIWIGGGVVHGPSSAKNYSAKINGKVKKNALEILLAHYSEQGKMAIETIPTYQKTKQAGKWMEQFRKNNNTVALIILGKFKDYFAFKNLKDVIILEKDNLDIRKLAKADYIIMDKQKTDKK